MMKILVTKYLPACAVLYARCFERCRKRPWKRQPRGEGNDINDTKSRKSFDVR
jgi:hypothetical protein